MQHQGESRAKDVRSNIRVVTEHPSVNLKEKRSLRSAYELNMLVLCNFDTVHAILVNNQVVLAVSLLPRDVVIMSL